MPPIRPIISVIIMENSSMKSSFAAGMTPLCMRYSRYSTKASCITPSAVTIYFLNFKLIAMINRAMASSAAKTMRSTVPLPIDTYRIPFPKVSVKRYTEPAAVMSAAIFTVMSRMLPLGRMSISNAAKSGKRIRRHNISDI